MKIISLLKNKTIANAGWLISEKIIQMLISLVVGVLTARYLGPSNYGLINYAASYAAFFTSFCTLGINSLLVKEFVDHPDDEGKIIGTTLGLRGISSVLSAITIICIVSILDRNEPITIAVVALYCISLILTVFNTFNYWFQRHLKSKYTAIATLIAYVVTAIYRIILIVTGKDITWFAVAASVDYLCLSVLLFVFYKRSSGQKLTFSWECGKALLSRSKYYILSGLMVAIYGQTDKLMLKQILDVTQTGYYATAASVNSMWCFVLAAIIDSLYPSIMEAHSSGNEALFKKRNRQLYAVVFYVSIAVAMLFNIFAELVIWILYGQAFMPSATPLRIISWYTAFSYLGVARNAWLVCKNQQKHLSKIYIGAAVINVCLNALLIPLWGACGAALASLISQILTGLVLPFFIKDLRPNAKLMIDAILLKDVFPRKK